MKGLKRIIAGLASGIMMAGSMGVYAATDISSLPLVHPDLMEQSVSDVSQVIQDITEQIDIQESEPETSYVYTEEPSYTQVYYSEPVYEQQSMTYDDFMALYGNEITSEPVTVDTDAQMAYDLAFANYNAALAEYEAASQMIETIKEVEVEIIEEVTDEEGNVSEVTRTEIQPVTEMVPAGDVALAQANLDAAQMELDQAAASQSNPVVIEDSVDVIEPVTYANTGTCGNDLIWTLQDGVLTISGTGDMFRMPYGAPWDSNIQAVEIKEGVTSVGAYAFYNCTSLTRVSIPSTVTTLDISAFHNCSKLSSINIPSSVVNVNSNVFTGTPIYNALYGDFKVLQNVLIEYSGTDTEVTIPDTIVCIGGAAFRNNTKVKKVILPNRTTHIGNYAFYNCSHLESISLPDGLERIGRFAFYNCTSLKSVMIPDTVTSIGRLAFYRCTALSSVHLPKELTFMEDSVFNGCSSLKSIVIPNKLTELENSTFQDCTNLESVTIPDSLLAIGDNAFKNTKFINSLTGEFQIYNNVLFGYTGNKTDITIPSSVTRIAGGVFSGRSSIKNINLPSNLKGIGMRAFENCSGLTSIHLPDSLKIIDNAVFSGCTGLTGIKIPDGVTKIDVVAFEDCSGLKKVELPKSLSVIATQTFYECTGLTDIVIPDSVVRIEEQAFWKCTSLPTITISKGVTTLGPSAFGYCENLSSVVISNSLKSMGRSAFDHCEQLQDIYYRGTKQEWNKVVLSDKAIPSGVTIHYVDKDIPFIDVTQDDWYYSTVKECYETGLINGTSATTFSPMQTMTRAMVVTILWRMEGQPKTSFNNKFKDVKASQWYATSISWAVNNGVVYGYGDGTFKPDGAVTREQVAVMLANYAGYKGLYKAGTKKLNTYPDGSQVSSWAQSGMKWAISNGIISGDGAGYLHPKKSATRAEGAAMLLRMNKWLNQPHVEPVTDTKGLVGFVEWMIDKGYASKSHDLSSISELNDNLSKYNTDASSSTSPFNLDNVAKSIDFMKECNDLRAKHNLSPLKITNYMMLVGTIQNCASWELMQQGHWGHSRLYEVGENIAYNHDDPFDAWYYEEKAIADAGGTTGIGHYKNIINSDYEVTGFSWGFEKHAGQVFSFGTSTDTVYGVDQYLNYFNQYRKEKGI